jgi:phosphatidylserine/phosphatidylglycerophosphate/cardiolipin synthase-like enzyme
VLIVTPYFLPDASLIAALNVAALRGVQVDIVLPAENDLTLVQWASTALLWQVLERGCRVWLSLPPFDHTKLMLIDGLSQAELGNEEAPEAAAGLFSLCVADHGRFGQSEDHDLLADDGADVVVQG